MNIHEYQAKDLFNQYGIRVSPGIMVETVEDALKAAKELKAPYVIKAQIHSGGRGKAGGVKVARNLDEVKEITTDLLGKTLYTKQVPQGKVVSKLLITEAVTILKEYYFAMSINRATGQIVLMGSVEGGMEIEEVAKNHPEKIATVGFTLETGLQNYHVHYLLDKLGLELNKQLISMLKGMAKLFVEKDCSLVEINPLALLDDGSYLAADAKVNFDDNALFRHPDIEALRDENEEDKYELEAKKHSLSYVSIGGNVGCMVNGAGLAMATMDMINSLGIKPANFLDVGGTATAERVCKAFEIILSDPEVKIILVNIFGGIVKCDAIAEGIVEAVKTADLKVPLVVRFEGTNMDIAKQILKDSKLKIQAANSMREAVDYCCEYLKEAK